MTANLAWLFEQYYSSLVRLLYRRTGHRERAEALARETFARIEATPPDHPRPWLFAIALSLVREEGRAAGGPSPQLALLRSEEPLAAPVEAEVPQTEAATVNAALATLGARDRETLLLHAEGFSYEEIAATLGLAEGVVAATLARASRRLVEAYQARGRGQDVAS